MNALLYIGVTLFVFSAIVAFVVAMVKGAKFVIAKNGGLKPLVGPGYDGNNPANFPKWKP